MNLQVKGLNRVNLQTKLNALKASFQVTVRAVAVMIKSLSLWCSSPDYKFVLKIEDNFQLLGTHSFEFIPGMKFGL